MRFILFFYFLFLHCRRQWTSLPTHRHLLQFKKKKNTKTQKRRTSLPTCHHPLQPKKKNLNVGFSWVAGDDDEPPNSSSSLSFFSSFVKENNEPGGSSSSFGFFLKCRRWQQVGIPTCHYSWLFCFNSKRWQWTPWLVVIFYIIFYRCRKQQWARRLIVISWFFSSCVKNDDNKLGSRLIFVFGYFTLIVWK